MVRTIHNHHQYSHGLKALGYNVYNAEFKLPLSFGRFRVATVSEGNVVGFAYVSDKSSFPPHWTWDCVQVQPMQPFRAEPVVTEPEWITAQREQDRKNDIYVKDILENCGTWPQKRSNLPDVEYHGQMNLYPVNPLFDEELDISIYVGKLKKRDQNGMYIFVTKDAKRSTLENYQTRQDFLPSFELSGPSYKYTAPVSEDFETRLRSLWPNPKSQNFDDVTLRKIIDLGIEWLKPGPGGPDGDAPSEPPEAEMATFELVVTEYINQYFVFITGVADPYLLQEHYVERKNSVSQMVTCAKFIPRKLLACEKAYAHLKFKAYRKMHRKRTMLLSPFEIWDTNMAKRRFDNITFNPNEGEVPKTQFNEWRGLSIKKEDATEDLEDEQVWDDHILNVWAAGNKDLANKIHAWFATIIQKPGTKVSTNLFVFGRQGSGKGCVMNIVGAILGPQHFFSTLDIDKIIGQWSMEDAISHLLCFLDECMFVGDSKGNSKLKGLTTESTKDHTTKYQNSTTIQNYTNYAFASNHHRTIKVESTNRRNVMLMTQCEHRSGSPYFERFNAIKPSAIAHKYYKFNLEGINMRILPHTEYERAQKLMSMTTVEKWWLHVIKKGRIGQFRLGKFEVVVPDDTIIQEYNTWYDVQRFSAHEYRTTEGIITCDIAMYTGMKKDPNCRLTVTRKEPADPYEDDDFSDHKMTEVTKRVQATRIPPLSTLAPAFRNYLDDQEFPIDDTETFSRTVFDEPANKKQKF